MLVRPSLVLQIMLKPDDYSEATVEELKRSYIYLAQSIVRQVDEDDLDEGNVMRLSIRLMRPYWDENDPKAQELWEGVMPQWLRNATRNVSTAMHNYNTVDHPVGANDIIYDWADFEFGRNVLIRIKVDTKNRISADVPAIANAIRSLLNTGHFGDAEITLIRIPSRRSLEEQRSAALEAKAALQHEEPSGIDDSVEQPELSESAEIAALSGQLTASAAEPAALAEQPAASAEQGAPTNLTEPDDQLEQPIDFDIDYTVWGIEFTDGTIVEFDSSSV